LQLLADRIAVPCGIEFMIYGTTHGVLKPLNEAILPDLRFQCLKITCEDSSRPFELADMHQRLSETILNLSVPEKIRVQFETARNLMLYTWFVFEFQTVAEMQAYASLELALSERFSYARSHSNWQVHLLRNI
jgi:hypothetical protein